MQQSMARDFLVRLSEKPTAWQELLRFYFTAAALKAVYNLDISDVEDSRVAIIENIFEGLREVTISAQFLLERVPLVQHLPTWTPGIGKFFKKVAASKAPNDLLMETEFAAAKERMEASGTVDASVVSQLLSRLAQTAGAEDDTHEEEVIASGVAAVAVEALRQTFSTSAGFFAAMVLHPEVQQKAQAELEAVVGQHRLPDFEDKQSLVYINAIVKEILRWHNVLPLGVSHRTTEDNELRGYFIPQGTMLTPAVWACMHDPEIYPDPDRFYPERFIRNGQLDPTVLDPADFVFGFGRRKCPGRHFAEAALFILIASVLHVFEIGSPKDEDGRPVKLEYEQSHGFLSYPENFECTVKLRSAAEATSLIRDSRPQQDPI
ncbi:hypothetical protein BN946_scf184884.g70 [Trametes cinnabarina]|uniref:Cytochrome P450 n=1 Tax=Pycnoporus cinnabarinus TaxID=5643 RepID=A0A060S6T2_PYCCI|nr:hypothetical protein BN946_scf184884.g70 [Trametes cinnabarina]